MGDHRNKRACHHELCNDPDDTVFLSDDYHPVTGTCCGTSAHMDMLCLDLCVPVSKVHKNPNFNVYVWYHTNYSQGFENTHIFKYLESPTLIGICIFTVQTFMQRH